MPEKKQNTKYKLKYKKNFRSFAGGASYSPEYYINIRTGIHYFPKGNATIDPGSNRFKSGLNRIEEKLDEVKIEENSPAFQLFCNSFVVHFPNWEHLRVVSLFIWECRQCLSTRFDEIIERLRFSVFNPGLLGMPLLPSVTEPKKSKPKLKMLNEIRERFPMKPLMRHFTESTHGSCLKLRRIEWKDFSGGLTVDAMAKSSEFANLSKAFFRVVQKFTCS